MQINLSDHAASIVRDQATVFGFGTDVEAYVSQLIATNEPAATGAVPSPKTREELVELIDEGMASGVAEGSWEDMMAEIKAEIKSRMSSDLQ